MMTDNREDPSPAGRVAGEGPLDQLIGREVVADTAGSVVYIGTLRWAGPEGLLLENADIHDCKDGHATKEQYVVESRLHGIRVNRRRILVMRAAVISVSALDDVAID